MTSLRDVKAINGEKAVVKFVGSGLERLLRTVNKH